MWKWVVFSVLFAVVCFTVYCASVISNTAYICLCEDQITLHQRNVPPYDITQYKNMVLFEGSFNRTRAATEPYLPLEYAEVEQVALPPFTLRRKAPWIIDQETMYVFSASDRQTLTAYTQNGTILWKMGTLVTVAPFFEDLPYIWGGERLLIPSKTQTFSAPVMRYLYPLWAGVYGDVFPCK